jgi:hypothetical protein
MISETCLNEVRERIEILGYKKSEITKVGIAQYGNTDPFPGRW